MSILYNKKALLLRDPNLQKFKIVIDLVEIKKSGTQIVPNINSPENVCVSEGHFSELLRVHKEDIETFSPHGLI